MESQLENQIIIKQAIKLGNSAGVILPKSWEYKKVKVELVESSIIKNIFSIIYGEDLFSEVIGIYLFGSYAREEEKPNSDIDVLVITENINRIIKRGQYDILFISKEKLEKNLKKSLYLYSIIKETKTLLNNSLIDKYQKEKINLPINKIINEISWILKINKESIELSKEEGEKIRDGIAYSIILRLRELFLVECLLNNKNYANKEFLKIIEQNNSKEIYEAYLRIKNDLKQKNNLDAEKLLSLIEYSEKLIKKIRIKNG